MVDINLCNYNLNATILGFLPSHEISSSLYYHKKLGFEGIIIGSGITIGGDIEFTVWVGRKIGKMDLKYMLSIFFWKEGSFNYVPFYEYNFTIKKIKIGFHGKRKII